MFGRNKIEEVTPEGALGFAGGGQGVARCPQGRRESRWHAPGAVHVPLTEVADAGSRFDGLRVLAMCRSGGRSATSAELLAAAGIEVRNVAGGMTGWAESGLPVVRDDGSPGAIA